MNAREKLNTWNIVAVIAAGLFLAGALGSGLVFWFVVAAGLWWTVKSQAIR